MTEKPPAALTLAVGEERSIVLAGLGTAGYRWSADVDRPAVASVELGFAREQPGPSPATFSRDERATLRGLAPGTTTVRFALQRSWETHAPVAEHTLAVTVVPSSTDDANVNDREKEA